MIYEIRLNVSAPVIATEDIHLDGIFYAVSPAAHNKNIHLTRLTHSCDVPDLPIPIDCLYKDGCYIYCCSTAEFINGQRITDTMTKRKDGIDYMYYHSQKTPKKGIDKDWLIKLYGVCCEQVRFLVSSSNYNALARYVRRIHSIGGLRKQGYGEVVGYDIVPRSDLTYKDCVIENGRAIRNIPQKMLTRSCSASVRIRPPYWLLDGKLPCATVGEPAELREDVALHEFKR